MELIPADSTLFRSSIEAIKEFLPQAQFRISETGLHINGMDVSHVGFTDYHLASADCTSLQCFAPVVLGLSTDTLSRVLNSVGAHDKVTMNEDGLELPTLTYEACVVAKTSDVVSVMKEVSQFGDSLHFCLDETGFHISASGSHGKVCQTLENTEDRDMTLGASDKVEATFGAKFVMSILKGGAPLSPTIKIEFEPSQPARFTFQFGKSSYFVGYLAPKLHDD